MDSSILRVIILNKAAAITVSVFVGEVPKVSWVDID